MKALTRSLFALLLLGIMASVSNAGVRKVYTLAAGATGDTTGLGMADSSGVLDVRDCDFMYLTVRPDQPCRIAFQVRVYGDSASPATSPLASDTTKYAIWPWRNTTQTATLTDTIYVRKINFGNNAEPASDELALLFGGWSAWGSTNFWSQNQWGLVVPLCTSTSLGGGFCLRAEYIQIRWRVLNIYSATTFVKPRISLHCYGPF